MFPTSSFFNRRSVFEEKYQVVGIKYQDARTEIQEIRLNSAWLEILVLALFNVSPLLNSSLVVRYSSLTRYRNSPAGRGGYLVFQFSASSFPLRYSLVDISLDSVFRTSYFLLCTLYLVPGTLYNPSFLPYLHRFHFSLLVQDFAVIDRREEDKVG